MFVIPFSIFLDFGQTYGQVEANVIFILSQYLCFLSILLGKKYIINVTITNVINLSSVLLTELHFVKIT